MFWLSLLLVSALAAQNPPSSESIQRGKVVFERTCVSGPCHGTGGEPGRAPRMKGRTFTADTLDRVIHQGVPQTNMPEWKDRLSENDIRNVIAYVKSLEQAPAAAAAEGAFTGPEQAKRGYAIFFEAAPGAACGTCHAMKGRGTSIAPDLTRWARLSPRAIVTAIRATRTEYTQAVKMRSGTTFPGMKIGQDEKTVEYYDLSVTPPAIRKLNRSEVESATDNITWKHPPSTAGYTNEQIADVIAYIRWASYGDTKGVKPDEIE